MALHIQDVIKYEGDNTTFVWKHECEDFNHKSKLIVHETQEAVFFANGQIVEIFGAGRYDLDSENYFFIKDLKKTFVTGGEYAFHSEVYFVNKTVQMGLKWGTDSKVRFIEPDLGIPLEIGASGEMNLAVSDSRKLITKLVGTTAGIAWGNESGGFTKSLQSAFRPMISTVVKSNLAQTIKKEQLNILEIDENLMTLSTSLGAYVSAGFEEYGLSVPQFYITNVVLPEDNPNFKRLKDLQSVTLQTRMAKAETIVRTTQAQSEAEITAARRQIEIEKQTTLTETERMEAERELMRSRYEAEKQRIAAQAEADAMRLTGFANAEVTEVQGKAEGAAMYAQGYNQRDVLQAEVQKAYAAGIGQMGANGGGGAGSGIVGDMLGLGVGMAAMGTVAPQMSDMMKGFAAGSMAPQAPAAAEPKQIQCPTCGKLLPENAKFCLECGTKIELLGENEMICPSCGKKTPKGKFCMECGSPLARKCPNCGVEVPEGGKFCLECGMKL